MFIESLYHLKQTSEISGLNKTLGLSSIIMSKSAFDYTKDGRENRIRIANIWHWPRPKFEISFGTILRMLMYYPPAKFQYDRTKKMWKDESRQVLSAHLRRDDVINRKEIHINTHIIYTVLSLTCQKAFKPFKPKCLWSNSVSNTECWNRTLSGDLTQILWISSHSQLGFRGNHTWIWFPSGATSSQAHISRCG